MKAVLSKPSAEVRNCRGSEARVSGVLAVMVSFASLLSAFVASGAELTSAQSQFFESRIRPILSDNCYKCHSVQSEKVKGGLMLDSREGLLKGGDTGPAIMPGDPE